MLVVFGMPGTLYLVPDLCVSFHYFYIPVDIQHNQCLCRLFNPREIQALWSQNYATEILHCNAVSRVDNAMSCSRAGYDRRDIHVLWKREKRKKQQHKTKRKRRRKTKEEEKLSCPPAGDAADTDIERATAVVGCRLQLLLDRMHPTTAVVIQPLLTSIIGGSDDDHQIRIRRHNQCVEPFFLPVDIQY